MKRVSTKSVSVVSGNKVFIGIDVHKDSWHITARTDGEEVFNGRIPASYHSFLRLLERFKDCQIRVAYEAGPCGFSLYDKLMEDGIDTIVVPPSLGKLSGEQRSHEIYARSKRWQVHLSTGRTSFTDPR